MAKWKLCRQTFGNEEYEFTEGDEVRIGRGLDNTITLLSIVISRHHCLINVKRDEVFITDLKSSNGIYVGLKRIPPNIPYALSGDNLIGFGWTIGAPLVKIMDSEKFIFKLIKCAASIINRIQFQNNSEEDIEDDISSYNLKECKPETKSLESPTSKSKLQLKRKLNSDCRNINVKKEPVENKFDSEIISIISDSDNESKIQEHSEKKVKLDPIIEDLTKDDIKTENEDLQYEAFKVKQEYLGYDDDEPIQIDSDSDSESQQWLLRLSQSSPGKPFIKVDQKSIKPETSLENSSYSQLDDVVFNNIDNNDDEEDFIDDLISIPPEPPEVQSVTEINPPENELPLTIPLEAKESEKDIVGEVSTEDKIQEEAIVAIAPVPHSPHTLTKKAQMIEPLVKSNKRKSHHSSNKSKIKSSISDKKKSKHQSSSSLKKAITNSQKEERRRKLKEIAEKEKETEDDNKKLTNNTNKSVTNVKITTSNRGAFLTNVVKAAVKPMKRRNSQEKEKKKSTAPDARTIKESSKSKKSIEKDEKHEKHEKSKSESNVSVTVKTSEKDNQKETKSKSHSNSGNSQSSSSTDNRIPFRNLKPLNESKELLSGKPVSKVEPLPQIKPKKRVRFSDAKPTVHTFIIEPGNKMNKMSSVKTRLLDVRCVQQNIFSLEKITLMKILCWNPQWLDEQIANPEPPPILGHNNPPMAIFHSFNSHSQYVGLIGDLLLMEIWECITQAYMRIRNQPNRFMLRIESLPPVPPHEQYFELFNLSVNLSLPTSETKHLPRVGEIMMLEFSADNAKICRFFFVHNVRSLPSGTNVKNSFFSLSLYSTFTDKMMYLKHGEVMEGQTLAYINNELILFEAMEYLAGSPLSQAILRPESHHYQRNECDNTNNMNTQWTMTLNPSQKLAVSQSVSAALGNRPSLQMVQGPPGTGKSSVICAIVMTYFYNALSKKQQDRGKILICATSNAAVDELVIRLLNIRQSLPKEERFRMVRVGRLEAMHARARDVSSQQLAQRDAERARALHAPPGRDEEIAHLEAKINMWKTQARDAKDPVRVAYCQSRVENLVNRISLLRGGGDELRPERLAHAERRIVDCAHIIVTTLASAHNYKMKGLKGRIALCIVDEAGQAIEPETLIPLTLDVTRLTLIGDPQQLPGFICSQRAKRHGLGESLFSRLTASCQQSVVLLDHQYRMQPAIADYPNRAFYAGRVVSVPPAARLDLPPYTLLAIASGDKGQVQSGANETEAWGVARVAAALAPGVRARRCSLAVITPYSAHRDLLRCCLRALQDPSEAPVEVNTVDSFQGQERDVVVVSLARSHGVGFLTDAGRMNVMLTRARHALLVCLNPLALVKNNQWQTLVDDARKRGVYKTLPNKICVNASRSISNEEVLKYVKNT